MTVDEPPFKESADKAKRPLLDRVDRCSPSVSSSVSESVPVQIGKLWDR
jgi:hypothetical protein